MITIVSGSRSLSTISGADVWAKKHIRQYLSVLGTTLVTGAAKGPDSWSLEIAGDLGIPWYSYLPSGVIESSSGDNTRRWDHGHGDPPSSSASGAWRARFRLRDQIMVGHVGQFLTRGHEAMIVGVVDPNSKSTGTTNTLRMASGSGICVIRHLYSPRIEVETCQS